MMPHVLIADVTVSCTILCSSSVACVASANRKTATKKCRIPSHGKQEATCFWTEGCCASNDSALFAINSDALVNTIDSPAYRRSFGSWLFSAHRLCVNMLAYERPAIVVSVYTGPATCKHATMTLQIDVRCTRSIFYYEMQCRRFIRRRVQFPYFKTKTQTLVC